MRDVFSGLLVVYAIIIFAGCGDVTVQMDGHAENESVVSNQVQPESSASQPAGAINSTQTSSENVPDETVAAQPSEQKYNQTEAKAADVREPGPPPPDGSKDQVFESPLRDIPLPSEEEPEPKYVEKQTIEIPNNWTRVTKKGATEVWIDVKSKHVIVAGRICLQQGGLEMFICPFHTKEHESVIAVNARSFEIHSSLLAIGCNPGSPVQWHPDYKPATGPVVKIDVLWKDKDGKIVTRRGQDMIQNFKTKKPMELDWVFAGSVLEKDPETGHSYYYADGGELVCLSNFSTAALDVPVQSSDSNEDLLYAANPEMIPEPGTKVYVIFKPEIKPVTKEQKAESPNGESTDNKAGDGK